MRPFFILFQSTFPQGERPGAQPGDLGGKRFNPRSRKGNDRLGRDIKKEKHSFNPRSRKGNDHVDGKKKRICFCFNPRSRKGNDWYSFYASICIAVSIHVPARGTTAFLLHILLRLFRFNPRSRKGNDGALSGITSFKALFQSTFPQGERHSSSMNKRNRICFNPRSRKGNDVSPKAKRRYERMFQSTFPQGERRKWR